MTPDDFKYEEDLKIKNISRMKTILNIKMKIMIIWIGGEIILHKVYHIQPGFSIYVLYFISKGKP